MRVFLSFVSILLVLPVTGALAQAEYVYMDRARSGLMQGLSKIGQWQTTHVQNQTVMQCTSCMSPVTVVLRYMGEYTKGSPFASARQLYVEGRKRHCQDLIASGSGRCLDTLVGEDAIIARSLEGRFEILEYVIPQGPYLLAGYVEAAQDAPERAATQDAMRHAVKRLSPLW